MFNNISSLETTETICDMCKKTTSLAGAADVMARGILMVAGTLRNP